MRPTALHDRDADRGWIDERGVSSVVGVVLLVAIAVVLAGLVATMATGFGNELQDPAPMGSFDREYTATGVGNTDQRPYVKITHNLGETVDADNVVIKDDSGNTIRWSEVWTGGPQVKAQEYVHIDGFASDSVLNPICREGQTYYVILRNDEGETLVFNEWTVPRDPELPDWSSSDSDDDGIPDWC